MIRKLTFAGVVSGALLAWAAPSQAGDIPATPIQHGAPRDLPGGQLIPGVDLTVGAIDEATKPLLQPLLALGEPAAAPAAAAPAAKHTLRHRHASGIRHWHGKTAAWHGATHRHAKAAGGHQKQAASHERSSRRLS